MKAKASTYQEILAELTGVLSRTVDGQLRAGMLVHRARQTGATFEQISADLDVTVRVLESWQKTSVFWGSDRIEGCSCYHHYRNCTTQKEKAFLIARGRVGCSELKQQRQDEVLQRAAADLDAAAAVRAKENTPAKQVEKARRNSAFALDWVARTVREIAAVKRLNAAEKGRIVAEVAQLCAQLRELGIDVMVVEPPKTRLRKAA